MARSATRPVEVDEVQRRATGDEQSLAVGTAHAQGGDRTGRGEGPHQAAIDGPHLDHAAAGGIVAADQQRAITPTDQRR